MTMDELDDTQLESLAAGTAAEQQIKLREWDLKITIKAAVWRGSARRWAWNAGLLANRWHWKAANRKKVAVF